jgi:hypothetical protein
VALAAVVHVLVILFAVVPAMDRGFAASGDEIAVIDIPPETKIPPPPEELARPATPVIATEFIEEEITIAETEIVEDAPVTPKSCLASTRRCRRRQASHATSESDFASI